MDNYKYSQMTQKSKNLELDVAVGKNEANKVSMLLLAKANPDGDVGSSAGLTPLLSASMKGHTNIARILIKAGATLDAVDEDGNYSGLIWAASGAHLTTVEELIKAKAKLDTKSHSGKTALMIAVNNKQFKIAFSLYNAMTSDQIKAAILDTPNLIELLEDNINQAILANQKKMFDLFGAYLIKEDTKAYIIQQPEKVTALQLSYHFPEWYADRIESDLKLVSGVICKMREKRKIAAQNSEALKLIFNQLALASPKDSIALIEKLGTQYTYQNCAKYIGYGYAAKAFANDATTCFSNSFSFVFNKATSYLPVYSNNTEGNMETENKSNKRNIDQVDRDIENDNENHHEKGFITKKSKKSF